MQTNETPERRRCVAGKPFFQPRESLSLVGWPGDNGYSIDSLRR